jgi:pimeloyl-ACP methyl ester carboxylesterase
MNAEREKLILLHGFLGCPSLWDAWLPALQERYELFIPALPGHCGRLSIESGHDMEALADGVLGEFEEKYPHSKAHWVGHSMGGYIGLAALERRPDRVQSLCMVNSSPFADTAERREHRLRSMEAARTHKDAYAAQTVRALFAPEFAQSKPEVLERAIEWGKSASVDGIVSSLVGMRSRKDRTALVENNLSLFCFIQGANDPVISPEDRAKIDRLGCRVAQLSTGHMSPLEAPEQSLGALLEFLNEALA